MFYPWECLSIYRHNFATLDLVIPDMNCLLALIHVMYKTKAHGLPIHRKFMGLFKHMKFRMKLKYEAWRRQIELATLLQFAILKTI